MDYVETLEAIIRVIVRFNDSKDGAVGDVRSTLGKDAAAVAQRVLDDDGNAAALVDSVRELGHVPRVLGPTER